MVTEGTKEGPRKRTETKTGTYGDWTIFPRTMVPRNGSRKRLNPRVIPRTADTKAGKSKEYMS